MAVTIQDDMWEAACTLPDDQRKDLIDALLGHAFDGEEPDPSEPWFGIYVACRGRVELSAKKSASGRVGGSISKRTSKSASQAHSESACEAKNEECDKDSDNGGEVRGDEKREDEKELTSGKPDSEAAENDEVDEIAAAVVAHLNELTSQSFRPWAQKTLRPIRARIREGFSASDLLLVVDDRCSRWLQSPKMREYLRPETLFGTKFEGYLQAAKSQQKGVSRHDAAVYDQGIELVAL